MGRRRRQTQKRGEKKIVYAELRGEKKKRWTYADYGADVNVGQQSKNFSATETDEADGCGYSFVFDESMGWKLE